MQKLTQRWLTPQIDREQALVLDVSVAIQRHFECLPVLLLVVQPVVQSNSAAAASTLFLWITPFSSVKTPIEKSFCADSHLFPHLSVYVESHKLLRLTIPGRGRVTEGDASFRRTSDLERTHAEIKFGGGRSGSLARSAALFSEFSQK
jgi:hypothetical protein